MSAAPRPSKDARDTSCDAEVERIRNVYERYRASPAVRRRWDGGNAGTRAIHAERAEALREELSRGGFLPFARGRVLEVGCGSGEVLASLIGLGAVEEDLWGVDLCAQEIDAARRSYPGMHWQCVNAEALDDCPSASFALVLAFTVFSTVLDDDMARNLASEMGRILRSDGAVLWYDFRYGNPYNHAVRGVSPRRVRELFPGWSIELRSMTVLPPLARVLGPAAPRLYPLLARVRPLRTHLFGLLHKPQAATIQDCERRKHDDAHAR